MVEGIYRPMHLDLEGACNIGNPEYVSAKELVDIVAEASGKRINVEWVKGPVRVQSCNFSNARICPPSGARVSTLEGIRRTYPWIEAQVLAARTGKR